MDYRGMDGNVPTHKHTNTQVGILSKYTFQGGLDTQTPPIIMRLLLSHPAHHAFVSPVIVIIQYGE